MGWMGNLIKNVAGRPPTDWTMVEDLADPGLGIAGQAIAPDSCYIELYVESLRLAKARKLATTFNGVVYSFIECARFGAENSIRASVTKPANLADLAPGDVDRVITVSRKILSATPWLGGTLRIELGLFSVKTGNLMSPLVTYITKVADKTGVGVITQLNPFLPLITEGLDLIAGQTQETEIELAIDTDVSIEESRIYALIAEPRGTLDMAQLSLDPNDRKLLYKGKPLEAGYCVFSIRKTDRNPNWGQIPDLSAAYQEFLDAVDSGKQKDAQEALAALRRRIRMSRDLIRSDKTRLIELITAEMEDYFPAGAQAFGTASARNAGGVPVKRKSFADLGLYESVE